MTLYREVQKRSILQRAAAATDGVDDAADGAGMTARPA